MPAISFYSLPGRFTTCMYYTYFLECADGTIYTGWTANLQRRVATHNRGKGARYTRSRLPVRLIYAEEHPDATTARKREYTLRHLSRKDKVALAASYQPLSQYSAANEDSREQL